MKKFSVLLMAILLVGICPTGAQAAGSVLGILEIRGIDNLADSVAAITAAAGNPVPSSVISQALLQGLLTDTGSGLNRLGNARLIWLANDTDAGDIVACLPVVDGGMAYLQSLREAGWANDKDAENGIQHFSAPGPSLIPWRDVYVVAIGNRLLAADNPEALQRAQTVLPELPPILPAEGDAAIQVRPAAILDAFSPQIQEGIDTLLQAVDNSPPEINAYNQLNLQAQLAVARAVEELTYGLGVASTTLNVHSRIVPKADTALETWLATLNTPTPKANVVNRPDALFAETLNLGDMSMIAAPYFRYYSKMIDIFAAQLPTAKLQSYLAQSRAGWALLDGNISIALYPPTRQHPLRWAEYGGAKDPVALRAIYSESIGQANDLMQSMLAAQPAGDLPFNLMQTPGETREVNGIAVDRISFNLEVKEELAQELPKGFPTQFDLELAWLPDGVLACMGEPELMDQLIASALTGGGSPIQDRPSWQALYPDPDPDIKDVFHIALFELLRAYVGLADKAFGTAHVTEIPAGPGNISGYSYSQDGTLASRIRISLTDLGAAIQKIIAAQTKAQQIRQAKWEAMMMDDADIEFPSGDPESAQPLSVQYELLDAATEGASD